MIYKLFLLSFVFFSMFINDNHCVQAQSEISVRYCRTTACTSRLRADVIRQCRRLYGSNVFRVESCDGRLARYTCCTATPSCLYYRCSRLLFSGIRSACLNDYSLSGFRPIDVNITGTGCPESAGQESRFNYQCCPIYTRVQ